MATTSFSLFGNRPRVRRLSTSSSLAPKKSRMLSLFNAIRLGVFIGILVCTVICLAIAAHFQGILVASDLTRFVPFALFVSVVSLLVILALLVSTFFKQRSPISTRIELACLGFLAVLWLALGSFLAASASAEADVECFSSDSTFQDPVEYPGFTTDIFHAQYRVLEAFSIFNLILVWSFLLFLLFLALRQHYKGYRKVWLYPVPVYAWFGSSSRGSGPYMHSSRNKTLPAPVTAMASRRKGSTRRPQAAAGAAAESSKPKTAEYRKSAFWVWVERPRQVPVAHTRDNTRDRERDRNIPERRRGEQPLERQQTSGSRRTHTTHPRPPRK